MGFKTKFGLQREKKNREGQEKGEKKRKRKRKRREEKERKLKGMETNLEYGIVWIYGILRFCMVSSLSPNLGF